MRQECILHLWQQLRAPFVLPPSDRCHTCEWEKIDIDVLGCMLCSRVHVCDYATCTHTIETGDGLVCEFSGVVIHTKKFVVTEFMDTICITGVDIVDLQQTTASDVSQIVTTLLCSSRHTGIKRTTLAGMLTRCCHNSDKSFRNTDNMMSVCLDLLKGFSKAPHVFTYVCTEHRKRLVQTAVEHCCRIFHILAKHGMSIRSTEVQRLAVGILYLMRCGVAMDGIEILPSIRQLSNILPPEATLLNAYGVHPKYITEMENRLKFCLRHADT